MSFESRGLRVRLAPLLVLAGAACASSPSVAPPQTHVRLEPPPATAQAPLPSLPPISASGGLANAKGPRVQLLRAEDQEFSTVVRQLAATFDYQYQIDPGIRGKVNATLRNATLFEALDAIMPQGATYEIKGGVLRIGPARLETKIFTLDYVALSRVGTASTVIQRRLGSSAVGGSGQGGTVSSGGANNQGGQGGALGGGADVISATSIADAWEEIRVAVDALTFDAPSSSTEASAGGGGGGGGGSLGLGGGRPWSRTSKDGRRVIISAMSGTITVTSLPARLAQIEHFIKTFETSVQRQVLIEAKIVEVNLDKTFEFGIDWNVVASNSSTKLSPGGSRVGSNVEFTLRSGGTQISAVLTALSSQGDVKVLSSPRVSALNNQRAVFDVTTGEIVFNVSRTQTGLSATGQPTFTSTVSPTQVNVGIVLDVLPQIGADNTVTMNIRPVVTSVARTATFTSPDGALFQAPVIDTRESDTMARLRAGETIIIGGLMQNRREKVKSGVPVLRSIPLLGRLFTRTVEIEHKAELVIFLTPTIIAGQPPFLP